MSRKRRLKNYLINKPVQFIYSGITTYFLVLGVVLAGLAIYYITLNTVLLQLEAETALVNADLIIQNLNYILWKRVGILLLSVAVFAFIMQVFFLHRLAGPLYRFQTVLTDMSEGKPANNFKLRKNDFLKPIADVLNRLITIEKAKQERLDKLFHQLNEIPEAKKKIEEWRSEDIGSV